MTTKELIAQAMKDLADKNYTLKQCLEAQKLSNEVADMVINEQNRTIKAMHEELIMWRMIAGN